MEGLWSLGSHVAQRELSGEQVRCLLCLPERAKTAAADETGWIYFISRRYEMRIAPVRMGGGTLTRRQLPSAVACRQFKLAPLQGEAKTTTAAQTEVDLIFPNCDDNPAISTATKRRVGNTACRRVDRCSASTWPADTSMLLRPTARPTGGKEGAGQRFMLALARQVRSGDSMSVAASGGKHAEDECRHASAAVVIVDRSKLLCSPSPVPMDPPDAQGQGPQAPEEVEAEQQGKAVGQAEGTVAAGGSSWLSGPSRVAALGCPTSPSAFTPLTENDSLVTAEEQQQQPQQQATGVENQSPEGSEDDDNGAGAPALHAALLLDLAALLPVSPSLAA